MDEFKDEIEALRKNCKALLIQAVQAPGSLLNCHVVSIFLDIPMRQCYRWTQPNSPWLPSLKHCEKITAFLKQVKEQREFWPELVKAWPNTPQSIKLAYFPKNVRRTLDDGGLTAKEKAEDLTIQTLRILRRLVTTEEAKEGKEHGNIG